MRRVTFPTFSPYILKDALDPRVRRRVIEGVGFLFEPTVFDGARPLPAVVVMEGLGGLQDEREMAYGAQLAQWGYIALVVDTFGARGGTDWSHNRRAVRITESMMLADAFAALAFLTHHPQVDPSRIAVMGFSYGAMVTIFAAYRQVNEVLAAPGQRFAAHAAYYGCTVARFERVETTGAPVMMQLGELDENVSLRRSREIAADLRRGGSEVSVTVHPETYHQWDGCDLAPRHVDLSLLHMNCLVDRSLRIRDLHTRLEMRGPISRRMIIGLGVSRTGYDILRSEAAKTRSDEELAEFLWRTVVTRPGRHRAAQAIIQGERFAAE